MAVVCGGVADSFIGHNKIIKQKERLMSDATILGSIMWDVLSKRAGRTLEKDEIKNFYSGFQTDASGKIEEIRSEQRRAYEEGKNLILS